MPSSVFTHGKGRWRRFGSQKSVGITISFRCQYDNLKAISSTRLVGLATLTGIVTSEALYHSPTQFKAQVTALIPALIVPLLEVEVLSLDHE